MNSDATEAALGLLGLSPLNAPPPAIVPLKRKQSTTSLTVPDESHSASSDAISCICGFSYDDGFSIACDDCSRWCHAACFDIVEGGVPEEWRCWVCIPRPVDREKAVKLQKARQKQALEVAQEKQKRKPSPGVERKQRRASAAAIEGSNSKRKRRSSINVHQPTEDEHVDIGEPWALSYVPITKDIIPHQETHAKLRRQAQHWRGVTALESNASLSPHDTTPIRLSESPLPQPSQTAIQPLPTSSYSHPTLSPNTNPSVRPPSYALHTTMPISSAHLIAPFTSTIIPSAAYLADPLNAYAHLGMPKPFVHLLGPPLDVTLDSRITGDKSRFVRSGCRPNAVLRPVLCPQAKDDKARTELRQEVKGDERPMDEETLTFGVFALRDLKANEEVVLGWEWDDGNAVHSLPALIESPHMFPTIPLTLSPVSCSSSTQLLHLRHQMTSILHALSSTFTTCACGSKARDCALTQMAAFVDGEIPPSHSPSTRNPKENDGKNNEKRKVDLGPLVGVQRGFKTREKIPLSSGMSGVEMVPSEEQSSSTPSSSSTPLPGPSRFLDANGHNSSYSSPARKKSSLPVLTLSPATASPSPKKKKDRKGKGRAVTNGVSDVEQAEALPSSPFDGQTEGSVLPSERLNKMRSREQVAIDPSPASSPGPSSLSAAMDVDDATLVSQQEESMPPKMRKRWNHRNSEALREWRSPASPSGSVMSNGSAVSGAVVDNDKMDVDHLDHKQMPPPPMPASLDPTTISSMDSRTPSSTSDSPFISQTSPSTSFSKLSLLSPGVSGSAFPQSSFLSHPSQLSSPPPTPSISRPSFPSRLDDDHIEQPREASPGSSATPAFNQPGATLSEMHRVRFASPEVLAVLPGKAPDVPAEMSGVLSEPEPSYDSPMSPDTKADTINNVSEAANVPDPPSLIQDESNVSTPSVAPSSPPPPPKVKMSLKDFALRKKKQREEEMAKTLSSPTPTPSTSALSSSPSPKINDREVDSEGSMNGQHDLPGMEDHEEQEHVSNHSAGESVMKGSVDGVLRSPQHRLTLSPRSSGLPSPSPSSPHSSMVDGHVQSNGRSADSASLLAKVEVIEEAMPSGMVATDDGVHHLLTFPPEPPPPPLNGHAKKVESDHASAFLPSPPPPGAESVPLTRRPSHEDGEIPSTTPPKPSFFPRSHTPPTQPRSFHVPPSSPGLAPTTVSSVPSRRPPPPPPLSRSQISNSIPAAISRPVPSGPRALRASSHSSHLPVYSPSRSFSGSQYIPRGPSADRDRTDWERERGWAGPPRIRGRGGSTSGWGR